MSKKYLGVSIEFSLSEIHERIRKHIQNELTPSYVCASERNVVSTSLRDNNYKNILNNSYVNICDGGIVALLISILRFQWFSPCVGAELFLDIINEKKYKQVFLGNTNDVLEGLKNNLSRIDPKIDDMIFLPLPFKDDVKDFNYEEIAHKINDFRPDIVWVSLGAPKQERFINYLTPKLDKGLLFAFGAIFNFYSGINSMRRAPYLLRKIRLEWLFRMIQEPKKNGLRNIRFILDLPKLILEDFKCRLRH